MKINRFKDEETWLDFRKGKILGTRSGDILPNKRTGEWKKGFWECIAEKVAEEPDGENRMERGKRMESDAVERFTKETGIKLDNSLVVWTRSDNENIGCSPDAYTEDLKTAVEVKCLNSASHIEALITKKVPSEYTNQVWQYFVTNDDLQKLYFVFYDPRIKYKEFHYLVVNRKDIQDKIDMLLDLERKALKEINKIVQELSF